MANKVKQFQPCNLLLSSAGSMLSLGRALMTLVMKPLKFSSVSFNGFGETRIDDKSIARLNFMALFGSITLLPQMKSEKGAILAYLLALVFFHW